MEKNCLVTKYKATVNDNSLLRIGEIIIEVNHVDSVTNKTNRLCLAHSGEEASISVEDGALNLTTNENMSTGWVSKITLPKGIGTNNIFVKDGNYRLRLLPKYNITKIGEPNIIGSALSFNTKYLEFMPNIQNLVIGKLIGEIDYLKFCPKLIYLITNGTYLTGDIKNVSALTSLSTFRVVYGGNLTGDINSFSSLTNIADFALQGAPNITGNIDSFSSLTNLQSLIITSPKITGDIGSLSTLTKLTNLGLNSTKVTGNIKDIVNPLTSINIVNTMIGGELIEFVQTQRIQGRLIGSLNNIESWGSNITFNGSKPSGDV